ncbi:ABC transporter permease [Lentzea tibetensis]|uniref:ABC transporter permease n=1 Tax=Lentzea tibetensis TaxID=2591470 RepID=A0A563ES47_9PSEU|nr:ABC transporter permease [Lentzea tibetensis]TWP50565.1 ABC transporter permease [Lentzea tibetensis]
MHATAIRPAIAVPADEVDNRAAYVGFAFAYVLGHGAAALAPVVALPTWLPIGLLAAGLVAGTILAVAASLRAQRGATESRRRAEKLVGTAWVTGFAALALAITGLSTVSDAPELQGVLWPAGSTIVVGLIYLAEGAVRRNTLHYHLGTWLALVAAASLFVPAPGFFAVLAVLGGGAYLVAAVLERRRLTSLTG